MSNIFNQLRQKLSKPILFGLYGAGGCLLAATTLGEILLAITKLPPPPPPPAQAVLLLIDCSGSMDGNKLREVKTAAQNFAQRQDLSENRLAVIGFGTNIHIASGLTGNKIALDQAISQLSDGGGTRMDIAIQAATEQLQTTQLKRNILLFTDGEPGYQGANRNEEQTKTLNAAETAKNQGINLIAVGTGDANTNFLSKLTGNSSLVFYANSGDFDQAFRQAEKAIYSTQLVESGSTGQYSLLYSILRIGSWTALLATGTSLALIVGQNHYLRRRILSPGEATTGTLGSLAAGLAAGALGQLLFTPLAGVPLLATIGRIAGWAILGGLLGGGMSFFVPNLELRRASQAGGAGGAAGAIGFLLISTLSGDIIGRLAGAAIIGFFIGLAIALIEQLLGESCLIVHWTPSEQTKINIGAKPILLGSSNEAHIYLRKDQGYPPLTAKIYTENQKIIMEFDPIMQEIKGMKKLKQELSTGDRRKLGDITLEITTNPTPSLKKV